jgi:glutamine cyclotransferase
MLFDILLVLILNLSSNDASSSLRLNNYSLLDPAEPITQKVVSTSAERPAPQSSTEPQLYSTTSSVPVPLPLTDDRSVTRSALITQAASITQTTVASSNEQGLRPLQHFKLTLPLLDLQPEVLAIEPYNQEWFTQGLYKDNDGFYISSGLYNKSMLIYQSSNQRLRYFLPPNYFAEGLTVVGDKLFLLTWKEQTLLIFDKATLTLINKIAYEGEGWGLTHTEKSFIMSNGSNTLEFRDKQSFEVQHALTIKNLNYINELEYVDGVIWANRWYDDKIYALDSTSGCIITTINLMNLRLASTAHRKKNVTNGIAYDKEKNGLWVTGKYWKHRFLIAIPLLDRGHCEEI